MIAAAMASSSRNRPALPPIAPLTRAVKRHAGDAVAEAGDDEIPEDHARSMLMPDSRAASGLPPIA